ncbi:hypothetical protein [Nocardioides jejuensis]|uniref:Uncharacterized protein n=1 Tax=Nocardioides jejuensis TaxID=2502782 RepID=A0A4R1CGN3_9ACTN|nr:hypothetical protein [Nocardioides jejuensis]TCJ29867.1 hypothetical protein EPD65_06080 [Nocardioides jejuensis]
MTGTLEPDRERGRQMAMTSDQPAGKRTVQAGLINRSIVGGVLLAATISLATAACGSARSPEAEQAGTYAFDQMAGRVDPGGSLPGARSLADALPNRMHLLGLSRKYIPISDAIVLGHVIKVDDGDGFRQKGGGDGPTRKVGLREPEMMWGYVVVTIDVEKQTGTSNTPVQVALWLTGATDIDKFKDSIAGLDDVLVVLDHQTISDGRSLVVPALQATLFGDVVAGKVRFPALGDAEATFVGSLDTPAEIFAQAAKPVSQVS